MTLAEQNTHTLADWQERLVATFSHIEQTRMQGVPVLNSALQVNADHFIAWQDYYLGVMITPWFMNLMLAPASQESTEHFAEFKMGQKQTHVFPSGPYEFIVGHEPELGNFQSCSLFSPMFEFADQSAALDTASAVLLELMKAENLEELDTGNEQSLHDLEANDGEQQVAEPEEPEDKTPLLEKSISRRQLFLGGRK